MGLEDGFARPVSAVLLISPSPIPYLPLRDRESTDDDDESSRED